MNSVSGESPSSAIELDRLWQFMSRRRHVAGRDELIRHGFSPSRIKNWLRGRRLTKLFHGIYAYGRDIETRESAWRAALLVAGPGSALTSRSALELLGAARLLTPIPPVIHVATSRDRAGRHRGLSPALRNTWVYVVRRRFDPGDLRERGGLAVVRVALALLDFAVSAPDTDVKFAFLELCRLRLFGEKDVQFCFRRSVGKRGALKVRPLLGLWVPELNRIKSVLEGLFLLSWVPRRWKLPEVNVKIFGREVDFLWRKEGLVLELDGDAFHTDPIARQRDLEKARFLESKGLTVIRITWKEFMEDPDGVVERIARELGLV
ncbi:MAG TPA: DUF559 domain-containing protein [Solirubrobacterales bacterium]|jgi:hypothetical protein|nr:DUF559 domain-containing protein [Solirubrobacterales bacterium]HNI39644.1 DUF559 domain-containing protein [Solirubrobacterales bacterium]HNK34165.1 DUF559 domain-containing protein [Solirubrobacterales bacterium]